MTKDQVLAEAMSLAPVERAKLIEDLRQAEEFELSADQIVELRRRLGAIDRGDAITIPGDEVFREVRECLGRR